MIDCKVFSDSWVVPCWVLLLCLAQGRAQDDYNNDCSSSDHIIDDVTAPGGGAIPITSRSAAVAGSALHIQCFATKATGCEEDAKATAHLEFFAHDTSDATPSDGPSPDSSPPPIPTKSYPVSQSLGGSVRFLIIYFPMDGYYVIRYRQGLDGDVCAKNGMYAIDKVQKETTSSNGIIVNVCPPVVALGDTISLTLEASPFEGMKVFGTAGCVGSVVRSITRGERTTVYVTLPLSTDEHSLSVCYGNITSSNHTHTINRLALFDRGTIYSTHTIRKHASAPFILDFRVYLLPLPHTTTLKLVHQPGKCDEEAAAGTTVISLARVTKNGQAYLEGLMPVNQKNLLGAHSVCISVGPSKWAEARNLTMERPGVQSYVECGFSNMCQENLWCPFPTSPSPTSPDHNTTAPLANRDSRVPAAIIVGALLAFVLLTAGVGLAIAVQMRRSERIGDRRLNELDIGNNEYQNYQE